jgi:hypothetical protein
VQNEGRKKKWEHQEPYVRNGKGSQGLVKSGWVATQVCRAKCTQGPNKSASTKLIGLENIRNPMYGMGKDVSGLVKSGRVVVAQVCCAKCTQGPTKSASTKRIGLDTILNKIVSKQT